MISWSNIIKASDEQDWEIKYDFVRVWSETESPGLKMRHLEYPVGMKENEVNFIYKTIVENNLKSGFEIATGFGASAYGAGLGFKETGGTLITMDAYIEEAVQNPKGYHNEKEYKAENPVGYQSVLQLIEFGGLVDYVVPEIGFSPQDVSTVLKKHNVDQLDYLLIDGGHWDEAVIRDIEATKGYLADGAWIFLHDVHCLSKSLEHIKNMFNAKITTPNECKPPNGWNLSYVDR